LRGRKNTTRSEKDALDFLGILEDEEDHEEDDEEDYEEDESKDESEKRKIEKKGEDHVQTLLSLTHGQVARILAEKKQTAELLVVRDTHSGKFAPVAPHRKPDHCWVPTNSASAPPTERVCWEDIVSFEEAKFPRRAAKARLRGQAAVQLVETVSEILKQQQQRRHVIVYFVDWRTIEFFKFSHDFETRGVERTGQLPFFPADLPALPTNGFRMYLAFRLAPRLDLFGFSSFQWAVPENIQQFVPGATIRRIRAGNDHKPNIYHCRFLDGHEVVVKAHLALCQYEAEINTLKTLGTSDYLPELVNSDEAHLLISTKPFAPRTLADAPFSDPLLRSLCRGAAWILRSLHKKEQFYCDPSPRNVLVFEWQGSAMARWNDFADVRTFQDAKFESFCGTHTYASPNLSSLACPSPGKPSQTYTYKELDDCYAVFFTILEFCLVPTKSGRKTRLPWAVERRADCWLGKLNWVQIPSFAGVDSRAQLLLEHLFSAWFHKKDAGAGLGLLEEFGNQEQTVVVEHVYHYVMEPDRGVLHIKPKCGGVKKDLPVSPSLFFFLLLFVPPCFFFAFICCCFVSFPICLMFFSSGIIFV
jgi:hypothetical protein